MKYPPDLPDFLCGALVQSLLPATLLLTTSKGSALRYMSIPCMVWIASRLVYPVPGIDTLRLNAVSMLPLMALQAANLMLINPLDRENLCAEKPEHTISCFGRLSYALQVLAQPRGVNTPRQVKNVPPHPAYYIRSGSLTPCRGRFLTRQCAILAWYYLCLDFLQTVARQQATDEGSQSKFSPIEWAVPVDKWIERVITNLVTWLVVTRIIIDTYYRASSIIFVGLRLDSPSNWPPAFGRVADAYTLRNFWGKFWHQLLRQQFTSLSNFIARDILRLPRPSIQERYTNIFIVFLLSGLLHFMINYLQAIPLQHSGAMLFFTSMVLGIMFEDGIQAVWKRIMAPSGVHLPTIPESASVSPWKRAIGMCWVTAWIGVLSTVYFEPQSQLPKEETSLVPFSVVERLGLRFAVGILVTSGVILSIVFRTQI
ncbi:hypothetical protein N7520_009358 [Penicillium odoratum]|uniref:uncharacterized protein n=1 Tax=Penicillium odoratum TaxID=1167516 RepID=UPI0025498376|nr:uncharacterized protein N7520_009358 [Penicillium odoratum]KAJ5752441.1 hypothetical protein N7520_009358 [Penicillium odoratum]